MEFILHEYIQQMYLVKGDRGRGAETRENKGGKREEVERLRESCEGGRQEKNQGH